MIWTAAFWRGTAERAVKTWIQGFVAVLGVLTTEAYVTPDSFVTAPWATAAITASVAAALSVATSIGNADFTAGTEHHETQL